MAERKGIITSTIPAVAYRMMYGRSRHGFTAFSAAARSRIINQPGAIRN